MPDATMITAADIARLANVTRATVSHWRKRHADFPEPAGGTAASPAYEREQVLSWLRGHRRLPEQSRADTLWAELRHTVDASTVPTLAAILLHLENGGPRASDVDLTWTALAAEVAPVAAARGARRLFDELHDRMLATVAPRAPHTPPELAALMAAIAGPRPTVLDPACGSGNLLLAALAAGAGRVHGHERDPGLAALSGVRLAFDGGRGEITVDRPFGEPRTEARGRASAVVCHPPFKERATATGPDPRWTYGRPPRNESELAWLQHCLWLAEPGAPVVLLLPPAVASRPSGRAIRAELLRRGALRAVVALPPGAAPPAHLGLHLWILTAPTVDLPQGTLFVDGSACTDAREVAWRRLSELVLPAWREFADSGEIPPTGTRRVVPAETLLDDAVDLTPSLHVAHQPLGAEVVASMADGLTDALEQRLRVFRKDLGRLSFAESGARARWELHTVADLERGGELVILRAEVPQVGDIVLRGVGDRREPTVITEANAEAAGSRFVLRPAPGRLDPSFLAGFLGGPANKALLDRGPGLTGEVVRRLTVPVIALPEQRALGRAFAMLRDFEESAERVTELGRTLRRTVEDGLATGVLEPG
ncbi:N-6 DNA methylase [Phytomonospora sp. NPDC050363]|uniref:N-6 DNA methylase n=1 Tax=Phytomonospora sp. NPDC050363 TaxID=3155642 RepID=UPI0033FE8C0F